MPLYVSILNLPDNNTKNKPAHMNMHMRKHKNIRDAKEVTGKFGAYTTMNKTSLYLHDVLLKCCRIHSAALS